MAPPGPDLWVSRWVVVLPSATPDTAPMADEVQRFRDMIAAWNGQDWDAIGAFYADDAVLHHPDGWPEPGPSVGREEIVGEWIASWQAWGDAAVSVERAELQG